MTQGLISLLDLVSAARTANREPELRRASPRAADVRGEASGWLGDVEVSAKRFADDVARGRVIVGGSRFDCSTKGGVESDRNNIGGASSEWWAAAAAWCEPLDVDITGDLVGEGVDVSVAEYASGLGDVGLGGGCGHVRGLLGGAGCETLGGAPWRG